MDRTFYVHGYVTFFCISIDVCTNSDYAADQHEVHDRNTSDPDTASWGMPPDDCIVVRTTAHEWLVPFVYVDKDRVLDFEDTTGRGFVGVAAAAVADETQDTTNP